MPERGTVLLVSHSYPPRPSPASRRPFGLAKYMRQLGYRVIVLTSDAWGPAPPSDPPGDVIRARDLIGTRLNWRSRNMSAYEGRRGASYSAQQSRIGRTVVPDIVALTWLPFAMRAALRLRPQIDAVVTTSGPESTHLIGRELRRRGVPWVADLRDGWRFEPYREFPTRAQERLDARMERAVLAHADRLTAVSDPIAADLRDRLGLPAVTVPNGYDEEEVAPGSGPTPLDPARHSVVHTGRLATGGRTPAALIEALRRMSAAGSPELDRIEVLLVGPLTGEERMAVDDAGLGASLRAVGMVDHGEALRLQREADSLLLLTAGSRAGEATGKLFEYLSAERPILVLGEGTEAARIVEAAHAGLVVPADDPDRIAGALQDLANGNANGYDPVAVAAARSEYSHARMAERMADTVEEARRG